jgi:hypothetical protein
VINFYEPNFVSNVWLSGGANMPFAKPDDMDNVIMVQLVAIVTVPVITLGIIAIVFSARFKAFASVKGGKVQVESSPIKRERE